jgi:YrbI family 3-deoxy-D-manno-octulosonate 8-phosphate phosphatase
MGQIESLSGISRGEMAYIGDDVNDEAIMEAVGYSFAPADALNVIKRKASYVLNARGGEGAFREVADLILVRKPEENQR